MNLTANFGASVNISPTPGSGSVLAVNWSFGDGSFAFQNLTPTKFYLTSGTFPISFSATSDQGCITTTTTSLVIYPVPTLSYNAINPCVGAPITFSNASLIAPGYFISGYKWDFESDGITNSIQPNPTHTFVAPGIYTVQLYAISNYNCRDSIQQTITVYDIPKPSITTSNVCAGLPTVFSGSNSLGGVGAQLTGYVWSFGAGLPQQILSGGTVLYPAAGVYTINLTATNNFNCSASTQSITTVYQMPVADFTTNATCLTAANIFTNTSFIAAPDQIVQYSWDFGNGFVNSLGKDTSYVFTTPGMRTVTLQIKSNNQCTATKTSSVLVNANPVAAFSSSLVCVGDKINFTNISASADGSISTYAWDFEGDKIINQFALIPDFVYSALGSYPVTLKVTTVHGCTATATRTISANPKAVGNFTSDVREGCPELCVNFTNISSIAQGSFTSNWNFGDGSSTTGFSNPIRCFNEGDYDITLTLVSDSGCRTTVRNAAFIKVYANPVANFQVTPNEIDEDDPTISVNDGSSRDATFIKYFVSDGTSFGTPNFTHYIKNLEKKIKPVIVQIVKNQNGCADTLIRMLEIKPAFALYVPNVFTPNSDGRNDGFQAKGIGIDKFAMQIYDRWGRKVWETTNFAESWDGSVRGFEEAGKQDVYTWRAQVLDILGKQHSLIGHVTLLR
jgi:gliding motility-associated-like protein